MVYPSVNTPLGHEAGREPVWGIQGTALGEALNWGGDTQVFYIDSGHAVASDNHDGTDPNAPLATLQGLITRTVAYNAGTGTRQPVLRSYDTVYVSGNITETVNVPTANTPAYITIVGVGNSHSPVWTAATAAGTALTLAQIGWTISGFTFETGAAGTAIVLNGTGSDGAYKSLIHNCRFDGLWGGLYGISFTGAPHRVRIEGCEFLEYRRGTGTAYAIIVADSSDSNPYECHIVNNIFWENENHVGSLSSDRAWNMSTFTDNIFHEGVLIPATLKLDLRGGTRGNNVVTRNVFCGDYSNTGGYYANAGTPGMWVGNIAEDVAEAEVGDNGWTIAPPAA